MKIYEKPMAIIEKINVEDVITASAEQYDLTTAEASAVKAAAGATETDSVILFQW